MSAEQLALIVVASVAVLCGVTCFFIATARQQDRAEMINDKAMAVNQQGAALMDRNEEGLTCRVANPRAKVGSDSRRH